MKGEKTGLERGKNGIGKGKNRMGRGQKWVLNGAKMGFKRYKNRNLAKSDNLERIRTSPRPLSTSFQLFFHRSVFFHPFFHDFGQKRERKDAKKWRNGKGKKSVLSHFFPTPIFYLSFSGTSLVRGHLPPTRGYILPPYLKNNGGTTLAHIFVGPPCRCGFHPSKVDG